eukprot:g61390.t1
MRTLFALVSLLIILVVHAENEGDALIQELHQTRQRLLDQARSLGEKENGELSSHAEQLESLILRLPDEDLHSVEIVGNSLQISDHFNLNDGEAPLPDVKTPSQLHKECELLAEQLMGHPITYDTRGLPLLSSRPGSASSRAVLDFDGYIFQYPHFVYQAWGNQAIETPPYWPLPFNTLQQEFILAVWCQEFILAVWCQVVEDFAPFNIDVTTIEPDPSDFPYRTLRALFTSRQDVKGREWNSCSWCGGQAQFDIFGNRLTYFTSSNALVFLPSSSKAKYAAEIASHELGHNLNLNHDGQKNIGAYYEGEEGKMWAPIMGVGYYRPLVTWSKGDYPLANNFEDDILIMELKLGLRQDEPQECARMQNNVAFGFLDRLPSFESLLKFPDGKRDFVCNNGCDVQDYKLNDGFCDCASCEDEARWTCKSCTCPTVCGQSHPCGSAQIMTPAPDSDCFLFVPSGTGRGLRFTVQPQVASAVANVKLGIKISGPGGVEINEPLSCENTRLEASVLFTGVVSEYHFFTITIYPSTPDDGNFNNYGNLGRYKLTVTESPDLTQVIPTCRNATTDPISWPFSPTRHRAIITPQKCRKSAAGPDNVRKVAVVWKGEIDKAYTNCCLHLPAVNGVISNVEYTTNSKKPGFLQGMLDSPQAWRAAKSVQGQYLSMDLGQEMEVWGMITQGFARGKIIEWVSDYTLQSSVDGKTWLSIDNGTKFDANSDGNTKATAAFNGVVRARYVRVFPTGWKRGISLRIAPIAVHGSTPKIHAAPSCEGKVLACSYLPIQAALHSHTGWVASLNESGAIAVEWLQVDLGQAMAVYGVVTQGNSDGSELVTAFVVEVRLSEATAWTPVDQGTIFKRGGGDSVAGLPNGTREETVVSLFATTPTARFLRLRPVEWLGRPVLRLSVLTDEQVYVINLPTWQRAFSSLFDTRPLLDVSLLDSRQAWVAAKGDVDPSLTLDLGSEHLIFGLVTQGRPDINQWVTKYWVQLSIDGLLYQAVENARLFTGNIDRNSRVMQGFSSPLIARYLRLRPCGVERWPSMRVAVLARPLAVLQPLSWDVVLPSSKWAASPRKPKGPFSAAATLTPGTVTVDLGGYFPVSGVLTQGDPTADEWVSTLQLALSLDGSTYRILPALYEGNKDTNTTVYYTLPYGLLARYVRVIPKTWKGGPSLPKRSWSSVWNADVCRRSRLHAEEGWCAEIADKNQWLQLELSGPHTVTGVFIQGRRGKWAQWVTTYRVQTSLDGVTFFNVDKGKVFEGNSDSETVVVGKFETAMSARYVRLLPVAWKGHISMRADVVAHAFDVVQQLPRQGDQCSPELPFQQAKQLCQAQGEGWRLCGGEEEIDICEDPCSAEITRVWQASYEQQPVLTLGCPLGVCDLCQGPCEDDDDCVWGLVCHGKGNSVSGCEGEASMGQSFCSWPV